MKRFSHSPRIPDDLGKLPDPSPPPRSEQHEDCCVVGERGGGEEEEEEEEEEEVGGTAIRNDPGCAIKPDLTDGSAEGSSRRSS